MRTPTRCLGGPGADPGRWLTGKELDRYARFHGDDDRRMFLAGRMMARSLVAAVLTSPRSLDVA